MALPFLLRKLFQNNGAGPLIKKEIIPSLNSGEVTTAKLADGAVTTAKIASDADVMAKSKNFTDVNNAVAAFSNIFPAGAAAHNCQFRGRDLTNVYSLSEIASRVNSGNFTDLFIGDYITKPVTVSGATYNVNWYFADFDYFLGTGDSECTTHHIVLVPSSKLGTAQMNSENVITGGYAGSAMWKNTIPACATGIKNAFGSDHVLAHRSLLTTNVSTTGDSMAGAGRVGYASGWVWQDVACNLMNEMMVYGSSAHGSSFFDVGERTHQLALFRLYERAKNIRYYWWLSAVGFSSGFCTVDRDGFASAYLASNSFVVRPYFLFH